MTNLEALESLTEYRNDNLFAKVLLDQGVTSSGTYSSAEEQNIDMAYADVLLFLANHPNLKEGELSIAYDANACHKMRKAIYDKWGVELPEIANRKIVNIPVDAKPVTISGDDYSPW